VNLCFIPARGGSKRLPRKNLLPLGGRPLLAWTIDAARESAQFDEIVVSSDDDEILAIAHDAGVRADRRPAALGGDRIRFVEVLVELLRRPAESGRFITATTLLPTCPFRSCEDIRAAFALLTPGNSVVSVSHYEFPPEFAADLRGTELHLREPARYAHSTQSQSVPPAVHPNGAIYLSSVERLLATGSYFTAPVLGYLMPPERAFDIDFPHQFAIAEALLRPPVTAIP